MRNGWYSEDCIVWHAPVKAHRVRGLSSHSSNKQNHGDLALQNSSESLGIEFTVFCASSSQCLSLITMTTQWLLP